MLWYNCKLYKDKSHQKSSSKLVGRIIPKYKVQLELNTEKNYLDVFNHWQSVPELWFRVKSTMWDDQREAFMTVG